MSKTIEGPTTAEATQPSRRAVIGSALGVAVAAGVAGSANAKTTAADLSPKIAAAFAQWQSAHAAFKAAMKAEDAFLERADTLLPERAKWRPPFNPEQIAAIDAAKEISGMTAAEEVTEAACDKEHERLLALLSLQPETLADAVLQAKCLKEWLHDCSVEHPAKVWLETVTGEAWPFHGSDEAEVA